MSDRFDETKREEAKDWINSRYGRVWAQEAWTFKLQSFSLSLAQGAQSTALTGIQRVHSVWDAVSPSYWTMNPKRPEDFHYFATLSGGIPAEYTVLNGTLHLSHPASSARTYTVIGEAAFEPLVDDGDEPLLPEEFHYMLVHGAASEGLRLENDPTWQGFEQDYQANLADMKNAYLTSVRMYGDAAPSWP